MATSRGRQRIELRLIENIRDRAVTLSKRRSGLFKKASELATLCGPQIVIIVFTISGKPLAFGSPRIPDVTSKFLSNNEVFANQAFLDSMRKQEIEEANHAFNEFNEKSTSDKKLGQSLEEVVKGFLGGETYEEYKRNARIGQLMQLKDKLEHMNKSLQHDFDEVSGSSSSDDEYVPDLSTIEGPRDFLSL
ncbi:agamous-like MADS-box protein AGL29 [Bidens hawaiensis]|uniref:agamous-like MADS-box protein AGL29 n=1 Tax=Bidens hawaiensis TaxID=980011 RepID=UPI00404A41D6